MSARQNTKRHPPQIVGNAGLYYVCYQLSLRGWNAMPTAKNARGVDIVAYSQDGVRRVMVQVKALSKKDPAPLGSSTDNLIGEYLVVCRGVGDPERPPTCFVMTTEEVRNAVLPQVGKGTALWLAPKLYDTEEHREAWGKIGCGS